MPSAMGNVQYARPRYTHSRVVHQDSVAQGGGLVRVAQGCSGLSTQICASDERRRMMASTPCRTCRIRQAQRTAHTAWAVA